MPFLHCTAAHFACRRCIYKCQHLGLHHTFSQTGTATACQVQHCRVQGNILDVNKMRNKSPRTCYPANKVQVQYRWLTLRRVFLQVKAELTRSHKFAALHQNPRLLCEYATDECQAWPVGASQARVDMLNDVLVALLNSLQHKLVQRVMAERQQVSNL